MKKLMILITILATIGYLILGIKIYNKDSRVTDHYYDNACNVEPK